MTQNLKELIEIEKDFLTLIKDKESVFCGFHQTEKYNLSFNIVEKIILIQESILKDATNLIGINASLRYVLETLIQTELLVLEPKHTFILFYSIYNHQVNKGEKFLKRIKREMEIMEDYEQKDYEITKIISEGIENNEDSEKTTFNSEEVRGKLDEKADLEFTIFTGNCKWYGYRYTKFMMNSQVLPKYEERLEQLKRSRTEKAKEIVKIDRISKHFNFRGQCSKVFNELKDGRSWKEKAQITGLENEYELVYDLTSALLHSTSYSFATSNFSTDSENEMVVTLIYKYSKKIMKNINEYAEMNFYNRFLILELNDEEE